MRFAGIVGLLMLTHCGCALNSQCPTPYPNPAPLPPIHHQYVWDVVVDVVDDYFEIDREQRVRPVGNVLTAGRIDTFAVQGATLLEPWRDDTVNAYERTESTLQSIRRYAVVQVIPGQDGYLLDVAVFKELEDVPRPEYSTAGAATFRNDNSIQRLEQSVGPQTITKGWIPLGRDVALEQEMLGKVISALEDNGAHGSPLHHAQQQFRPPVF